jgi:hypothetical protein
VRQQWRINQGAISIHMPESSIQVSDGETVQIQLLEDSLARQMVAEMMILTGEVAARYGQEHDLAIPFRSQPQPELPPEEELLQLPSGVVRYSAIRRCMPRSEMGVTPARHATLGLEGYSQVTSPIRRYTDLLAHFQIKAHLRGESLPFSSEEMMELTQGASSAAYEAILVERQTKRYWALEYLRQHQTQVWHAMLLRWLRASDRIGLILLEELGLELGVRLDRDMALGEQFQVRVTHANPPPGCDSHGRGAPRSRGRVRRLSYPSSITLDQRHLTPASPWSVSYGAVSPGSGQRPVPFRITPARYPPALPTQVKAVKAAPLPQIDPPPLLAKGPASGEVYAIAQNTVGQVGIRDRKQLVVAIFRLQADIQLHGPLFFAIHFVQQHRGHAICAVVNHQLPGSIVQAIARL